MKIWIRDTWIIWRSVSNIHYRIAFILTLVSLSSFFKPFFHTTIFLENKILQKLQCNSLLRKCDMPTNCQKFLLQVRQTGEFSSCDSAFQMYIMVVRVVEFSNGGMKLERFLPKNHHTQRKLLNFENWIIRSFQKPVLKVNHCHLLKKNTVFPHIVAAATILFWIHLVSLM